MAEVPEIQFMKPAAFTVGADVYRGTTGLQFTKNEGEFYNVIPEGELTPTRQEQVQSDRPSVEFTVSGNSIQLLNLSGTQAATATIVGVDAMTGNAVTITLTNPSFRNSQGSPDRTRPGTYSLRGEATAIAFA
ncbi:MAG: hypothetical protein AAF333_13345 [Planctomycetota bacterium]